jgi:ribonuclease P protein component
MKESEKLTSPDQYTRVYNSGISKADRLLVLRAMPNQLELSRFGISISKRVGKAVVRNRVKRVLREILRQMDRGQGWDVVFIARNPSAGSDYQQLKYSVENLLTRSGIISK